MTWPRIRIDHKIKKRRSVDEELALDICRYIDDARADEHVLDKMIAAKGIGHALCALDLSWLFYNPLTRKSLSLNAFPTSSTSISGKSSNTQPKTKIIVTSKENHKRILQLVPFQRCELDRGGQRLPQAAQAHSSQMRRQRRRRYRASLRLLHTVGASRPLRVQNDHGRVFGERRHGHSQTPQHQRLPSG